MPKAPAAAKKSAPAKRAAAVKEAAAADAALDTKPAETEAAAEEPAREAAPMQAASEPTDFDHLLDLARAIDPKFGNESAKEGTQHFLIRLLTVLADSSSEQFESLPVSAQTWYENGVEAGNDKQDIAPPDGYAAPSAKPATEKKAAGEKKKAAAKTPREPKAPKEKKVREASKTMPVRLAVVTNPSITLEELAKLLPAIGKSTLSTTRSDTLATLAAVKEAGWTAPA